MTPQRMLAMFLAVASCCTGWTSEGRAQSTLAIRDPSSIESLPAATFIAAPVSVAFQTGTGPDAPEPVPTPAGEPQVGMPLEEFVFLAETGNPALREAAAKVQVAQGNAVQAGLYPNPTFYTGSPQWTGSISQYNWFVGQDFITAGKLKLDRAAGLRAVEQAQLDLTRTRFEVLTNVRRQFYVTAIAQRRVEVLSELLRVSANSRDIGRKLLKAGESNQADSILLEIENDKTEVAYQNSLANLTAARRQLAAVVGIPDMPVDELRVDLESALPEYQHEALRQGVVDRNALAAFAAVEIRKTQIQLRRAIVQPRPNFNIQAGYQYSVEDPHNDQGIAQLSMSVPLWNRNQGGIRAAQAETARATAALQRVENDLSQQTARALGEYAAAGERVAIYEQKLLPKAREVFRVNQSLFEQGQTDFLRLLQTQRTLIETDLGYLGCPRSAMERRRHDFRTLTNGTISVALRTSMPLPYQYRDTPLALLMAVAYFTAAIFWLFGGSEQMIEVTLADECCQVEPCIVKKALASLPTASDVSHHDDATRNVISLKAGPDVTPQQVWSTVESTARRPLRIVVNTREYLSKPTN